jgi:hypothetical protein
MLDRTADRDRKVDLFGHTLDRQVARDRPLLAFFNKLFALKGDRWEFLRVKEIRAL